MNKKNKHLNYFILYFSANILISFIYLSNYHYVKYKNEVLYTELQAKVSQTKTKVSPKTTQSPSSIQNISPESPSLNIDFDELRKLNNDIYAWIDISNIKINYPILQHPEDNTYYLYHNLNGQKGYPGCIYSENYNRTDFSDPVTILYGHHMNNSTMFGSLLKYEDPNFLKENYLISIYTPTQSFSYEIVLVAEYDNIHILKSFTFINKKDKTLFLENILNTSKKFLILL